MGSDLLVTIVVLGTWAFSWWALATIRIRRGGGKVVTVLWTGVAGMVIGGIAGAMAVAPPGTAANSGATPANAKPAITTELHAPDRAPEAKRPDKPQPPRHFDVEPAKLIARVNAALHSHAKGKIEQGSKMNTYTADVGSRSHFIAGVDKASGKVASVLVLSPFSQDDNELAAQASRAGLIIGAAMAPADGKEVARIIDSMEKERETFGNTPRRWLNGVNLYYSVSPEVGSMLGADLADQPDRTTLDGDPEGYVYPQCKQAVEQQLKSPSSADFPWTADKVASNPNDPNSFVVLGHVDAQNSFGATLRADWICQIAYTGGDHYSSSSFALGKVLLQER